jgi:hypothetical protein
VFGEAFYFWVHETRKMRLRHGGGRHQGGALIVA